MPHGEPCAADVVGRDVGGARGRRCRGRRRSAGSPIRAAAGPRGPAGRRPSAATPSTRWWRARRTYEWAPLSLDPGCSVANRSRSYPSGPDAALEPDEHLLEERVADVGVLHTGEEDDAEELRPLLHERPSRGARRVVELLGGREHALPGRVAHVVVAVEDAGDGRDRHSAELRDFPDVADSRLLSENVFGDDASAVIESCQALEPCAASRLAFLRGSVYPRSRKRFRGGGDT